MSRKVNIDDMLSAAKILFSGKRDPFFGAIFWNR